MITFFTICLDGMPWIAHHYPVFSQLKTDWRWIVVEGVAENVNCTSWCAKIPPRLSNDGTTEYIQHLAARDTRVTHIKKPLWRGKVSMCNAALERIEEPCLLWQVDSDELWTPAHIEHAIRIVPFSLCNAIQFMCRYFVGPDRYIQPEPNVYGNNVAYEWWRLWKFSPWMRFKTHEPPVLDGLDLLPVGYEVTRRDGLIFDHMAYATRKQMEFRANYYAGSTNPNAHLWRNCVEGWERLQQATLPCKLKDFFPWVDDKATVAAV